MSEHENTRPEALQTHMTPSAEARLATMAQQIKTLTDTMKRIEDGVNEVLGLDRTLAGLQSDHRHQVKEIETQWKKVDDAAKAIEIVDRKVEKLTNTSRGAIAVALFFISLIQGGSVAALTWGFSTLNTLSTRYELQSYQMQQMQREVEILRGTK